MKKSKLQRSGFALTAALTLVASHGWAQSATPSPATTAVEPEEETVILSPFVVDATEDAGSYRATQSLAGTRVRTDLKDIASSISVITADFLRDTGATNNQTLLQYTTNTEVGGVYGNYAGVGNTFIDGVSDSPTFLRPNNNTRVRGLDSADNTRDYFQTDIPWDSYIVGRVDLQRGPNSILFGIGSPAGIVNSSVNRADFNTFGSIENRLGSFNSVRFSLDYNHELLEDQLSVRVAALADDTKYRQKPAFNDDKRYFGALRWDPKLFRSDSAHTVIRANFEHGTIDANRPRVLPPQDRITPFFDSSPTGINRRTWDPYYAWAAGVVPYSSSPVQPGETKNFWLVQYQGPSVQATANPQFVYDTPNSTNPSATNSSGPSTYYGISTSGARDAGIGGFPYGSNIGIASFNEYAYDTWRSNNATTEFPAADKGFYKTKSLVDDSIFDYYNNLIDGPNKAEWQNWDAYNVSLTQTLFHGKAGVELAYDRQRYDDGQQRNLDAAYLSVDIRSNLMYYPWAYTGLVVPNPNAGRAFIGAGRGGPGNTNFMDRENIRATIYGDLNLEEKMSGTLGRILGRHVFTALVSKENYDIENRNYASYVVEDSWSNTVDDTNSGGQLGNDQRLDVITYLSGDLRNRTTAAGLKLPRITALQSPSGPYQMKWFDSHWNAPSVNPADVWANPTDLDGDNASTQSENPVNYAGWRTGTYNVFNAAQGDLDRLYTDVATVNKETTSNGVTWQGFLWEKTLVATVGYREDEQKQRAGFSGSAIDANNPTGAPASIAPPLAPLDPATGIAEGSSTSWGMVLNAPPMLRDKLPWGSEISLTYSNGRNTRVENRYSFAGEVLPNASGATEDYGVLITMLNDKLQFKATYYVTDVENANMSSVITGNSTLGNETYWLKNGEAWGTASALLNLAGRDGGAPGWDWYWNWAEIAGEPGTGANAWNAAYWDPTPSGTPESRARFYAHPETIKQTAAIDSWLAQMQPQSWYDAYGFPVDVAKAQAGNWQTAIAGWSPTSGVGGVQPAGGGRINGAWPTGTVNNRSEGYEFEVIGSPVQGWNVSINASKQKASQTSLGEDLITFIEAQHTKFESPAGDLRVWWGGDDTFRTYYNRSIWSAYQFQLQSNGRMVPEMAPWRFNFVTNYSFQRENLRGINVGLGYRWQDGRIVGYALNAAQDNLDIDNPYWSDSESWVDLWAGYERKLSEKLKWRVQLNLRNVGQNPGLVPISVQPDGSPGNYRIEEGMTWTLTNTFSF